MRRPAFVAPILLAVLAIATSACSGGGGDKKAAAPSGGQQQAPPVATSAANPAVPTAAIATAQAGAGALAATAQAGAPGLVATVQAGVGGLVPTVQTGAGAASSDACGLVTKQDVATALGEAVKDPTSTTRSSQPIAPGITVNVATCEWDSNTTARSVSIQMWRATGASSSQIRQYMEQLVCAQKERVSSLGDLACWYDANRNELQVLKGATFMSVEVSTVSGNYSEQLRTLAGKAVTKLP